MASERPTVTSSENQRVLVPGLTSRDVAALSQAGPDLIRFTPAASGWEIHLGPVCGVLELDACQLVVTPKLMPDGAAVIGWMAYARSVPAQVNLLRNWSVTTTGLRDLIVAALLTECAALLRKGLLQGYRQHETVDTTLRGRLDITRQITRRYGQVDQLHLRRFDRDTAIWENLICRAALDAAAQATTTRALRRRAGNLATAFPPITHDPAAARRWLATAHYHRLNARYRPAHHWAALLLNSGGVDDLLVPGTWPAGSLLLNMNRLWEEIVIQLCADASQRHTHSTIPVINVHETGRHQRPFRPDAFVHLTGAVTRPVDAKYKNYASNAVEPGDTHQLLTYASGFCGANEPHGLSVIVHPTTNTTTLRTLTVSTPEGTLGQIFIVGVDVASNASQAHRHLTAALTC